MSFWIMLIIMAAAALIGGIVNFLMPSNQESGKYLKPWWHSVILGFGASLLVPIFLELAQSKLMDNIHFSWAWEPKSSIITVPKTDTVILTYKYDSINKFFNTDTFSNKKTAQNSKTDNTEKADNGKNYLLWAAYCLLAAAAGFRFINMLINKIVLQQELEKTKSEKEKLDQKLETRAKQSEAKQEKEALEELSTPRGENAQLTSIESVFISLPPVIHRDDPQKDRFGGLAERNGRKLSAEVEPWKDDPDWFKVRLWVQGIDAANPLTGRVIFYLHNTFYKSVRNVEVNNNIAEIKLSKVYGAFTVGAIADNGKTLLELDLAEGKEFSKQFRER